MPVDHLRYDILVQDALRGMVRGVLADTARKGLPGDHHFFITFDTTADGVRLSERLRERYPQEMTIVLQHQFWDLKVTDDTFEVGLSFGGVPEHLSVPFEAVTGFADPSVQFALQFETLTETPEEAAETADDTEHERPRSERRAPAHERTRTGAPGGPASAEAADTADEPAGEPREAQNDKPGAEVVRLDRFRKK